MTEKHANKIKKLKTEVKELKLDNTEMYKLRNNDGIYGIIKYNLEMIKQINLKIKTIKNLYKNNI